MSLRFVFCCLAVLPAVASAAPALDLAGLSPEVAACTDFDRHVNGKWQASTVMPADKARIGSFDDLRDQSRRIVEEALVEAARQPGVLDTPGKRLATDYYASGMGLAVDRKARTGIARAAAVANRCAERSRAPAGLADENGAVSIWRSKYRTEALIDQLRTDRHSPPRYRVLGPLSNVPAFAQAFNCSAGAPMMRAASEQISIW